jgi:L-fuconolactonase
MLLVDAHHHFLDPERIDYPFLKFLPELSRYTGHEALAPRLTRSGVTHTVAVQAADCLEETRFLLEQAEKASWVAGVVGWVPLTDPRACADALASFAGSALCGIRHLIHDEPDEDWLLQPAVLESLALLASAELSFDVSAFSARHISHIHEIVERAPTLDVVLCHFGVPRLNENEWEPWASAFAEVAVHPCVSVKISGLDMTAGGCDAERFRPYFEHARACFGPERMIWASNWPVSLRGEEYGELLDTSRFLLADLTTSEREAVFGGNANRVYRLGLHETR